MGLQLWTWLPLFLTWALHVLQTNPQGAILSSQLLKRQRSDTASAKTAQKWKAWQQLCRSYSLPVTATLMCFLGSTLCGAALFRASWMWLVTAGTTLCYMLRPGALTHWQNVSLLYACGPLDPKGPGEWASSPLEANIHGGQRLNWFTYICCFSNLCKSHITIVLLLLLQLR